MIILIDLAILALDIFVSIKFKDDYSPNGKIIDTIAGVSFIIAVIALLYSIIALAVVHLPNCRETEFYKYQQRYEVITHALQDDSNNITILVDDIADYNSDVLSGRRKQDSFWLGAFEYDFYYDLDLIELGEEANEKV